MRRRLTGAEVSEVVRGQNIRVMEANLGTLIEL